MLVCILCTNFPTLRGPAKFYSMAFGILIILVIPALHIILDQSPILWIVYFVFSSYSRVSLEMILDSHLIMIQFIFFLFMTHFFYTNRYS